MAGIFSQGRKNTVRSEERKCQKCPDSMTCSEAWTHPLKSGLYPRRQISKVLWKPRVSHIEKDWGGGGRLCTCWLKSLLTEETSTGSRKSRGPVAVGHLQTRPLRCLIGDSRITSATGRARLPFRVTSPRSTGSSLGILDWRSNERSATYY